jgi:hypothetical protein
MLTCGSRRRRLPCAILPSGSVRTGRPAGHGRPVKRRPWRRRVCLYWWRRNKGDERAQANESTRDSRKLKESHDFHCFQSCPSIFHTKTSQMRVFLEMALNRPAQPKSAGSAVQFMKKPAGLPGFCRVAGGGGPVCLTSQLCHRFWFFLVQPPVRSDF